MAEENEEAESAKPGSDHREPDLPLVAIGVDRVRAGHRARPADRLVPGRRRPTQAEHGRHALRRPDHRLGADLRARHDRRPLLASGSFRMRPGEEDMDGPPIHGNTRLEIDLDRDPGDHARRPVRLRLRRPARHRGAPRPTELQGPRRRRAVHLDLLLPASDGGKEIASTQLYLPEGKSVKFNVQTKDVLHDFWVPAFRLKIDAVPGITTSYRVTPNRIGSYPVVCAELCGLGHAVMRQTAHVVSPADFDKWLADEEPAGGRAAAAAAAEGGGGGGGAGADGKAIFPTPPPAAAPATRSPTPAPTATTARTSTRSSRARTRPSSRSRSWTPTAEVAEGFQDGIMPDELRRHAVRRGDRSARRVPRGGRDQVMTLIARLRARAAAARGWVHAARRRCSRSC